MQKIVRNPLVKFALRWLVCSLGLWIAAAFLGSRLTYSDRAAVIIIAGLILAIINIIIKPILVILSLPALLVSLGLFMIVINGLTVYIASKVYSPLHVADFWTAMLAGLIIGLVNYLVTTIVENKI